MALSRSNIKDTNKQKAHINNLEICNDSLKDENFFLKNFINDLENKLNKTKSSYLKHINNLKKKINKINKINKIHMSCDNMTNNTDNESININQKHTQLIKQNNEYQHKNYKLIKDNKELKKTNKESMDNYNQLFKEFNIYRRDLEQFLEESEPLLPQHNLSVIQRINKLNCHFCCNFETAKKIDLKKNNKDSIPILSKQKMSYNQNSKEELPSLFTDLFSPFFQSTGRKSSKSQNDTYNPSTKSNVKELNDEISKENSKLHHTITQLNDKLNRSDSECDNLRYKLSTIKEKLTNMQGNESNKKRELVSCMIGKTSNNECEILNKEYKKLNSDFKMLQAEHHKLNKQYLNLSASEQQLKSKCEGLKSDGTIYSRQVKTELETTIQNYNELNNKHNEHNINRKTH